MKNQKASVLAIALVMLSAIALLSIFAMQRSNLQSVMTRNLQHKEKGFHISQSELESIYWYYATQDSATEALSLPLNSFSILNGEVIYEKVNPGHPNPYESYHDGDEKAFLVESSIIHTGVASTLVEGFSVGTFKEYGFIVNSISSTPNNKEMSDQDMGLRYIAPSN